MGFYYTTNLSVLFWGGRFPKFPGHPAYLGLQCNHSRIGRNQENFDFLKIDVPASKETCGMGLMSTSSGFH